MNPTAPDTAGEEQVFACLAEYSARVDGGESVAPEVYRDRLGPHFARFLELLEMEGTLRRAVEPHEPELDLPRATPARYSDFRAVGEGGMGLVFKATDNTLHRTVAFKVVKPLSAAGAGAATDPLALETPGLDTPSSYAFESLRKRFLQEAWVTSGLTHPGIIPIYELGETPQGVPYYTMRFVEGERTMGVAIEQAREGAIGDRLALLEPFLKVCDTIRYAHARGVVHRDLKPQNIAIGTFGEVIVLDWGLAKLGDGEDPHAGPWKERVHQYREAADLHTLASALGTPGYMAPEAALGEIGAVDERSDVYSLGVILFQILTGRLPFAFATFVELVEALGSRDAPRADALDPEVPAALADVCARALARDSSARPADVEALATAVRSWQVHAAAEREQERLLEEARALLAPADDLSAAALLGQLDRATAPLEQVLRKAPEHAEASRLREALARHRERGIRERGAGARRRLLAVGGMAALLVIAVLALVFTELLREERDQATERLWQSYRDQARAGRYSGRVGQRLESIAALEQAVRIRHDATLRNDVLACLPLIDVRLAARFEHAGSTNSILRIDPAFERYARSTPDGAIELCDLATGAVRTTLPSPGRPVQWTIRFEAQGTRLLAKHAVLGPLHVWDLARGERIGQTRLRYFHGAFDIHPDGTRAAYGDRDGTITLCTWPDEKVLHRFETRIEPYALRFSPDGTQIGVTSLRNRTLVVATLDGEVTQRRIHPAGGVRRLAWSPDGRFIATACADRNVHVWRADPKSLAPEYRVLRGHQEIVAEVAWTRDGAHLVSAGWDRSVRIWDPAANALRLTIPVPGGNIQLDAEDARLAMDVERAVHVYDLAHPAGWSRLPLASRAGTGAVAFDADGERLAVAEQYGVQLWELAARRVGAVHPGKHWSVYFLRNRLVVSASSGVTQLDIVEGEGLALRAAGWTPPVDLGEDGQRCGVSADGRWMAVAAPTRNEAVAFRLDGAGGVRRFAHPGVTRVDLSADGSMLVTGAWRGDEIRVWDVATGERLATVPATNLGRGLFTPDGRHLITSDADRVAVYDVRTWEPLVERRAPPAMVEPALSPRGDLLAVGHDTGTILLLQPATLALVARLAPPDAGAPRGMAFRADGNRLAVVRRGLLGTEIWDLEALRARLAALGLDWK